MRNWNAIIRDWNTTARSWKLLTRNHTFHFTWGRNCFFVRGRTFSFNSGRAGCNASRDHQYEIQSKRRRNFRQHARQGSIGGRPPCRGSGFHDLDSPEKELENLRARIKRTLQENADKSLQQHKASSLLPEESTSSPEQPALFSEENWVIKIPKKTPRCQPLLGVVSHGISGAPTSGIIGTCLLYTSPSPRD